MKIMIIDRNPLTETPMDGIACQRRYCALKRGGWDVLVDNQLVDGDYGVTWYVHPAEELSRALGVMDNRRRKKKAGEMSGH